MTFADRKYWGAIAAVALAQTAILGWIVWDRISLLRKGQEVVLETIPVDPRSLFRGDYVILNYPFSQVPAAMLPAGTTLRAGQPVYVALERHDNAWRPAAAALDRAALPARPDRPVLMGRARVHWLDPVRLRGGNIGLRYGIESYFVPEGKGRELEKLVGERKISAIVAIDAGGNAAIKGLEVEGKRIYDEPLL
jgi:uncharacterized membrane-anchored protein